jgi:hypothetical protein
MVLLKAVSGREKAVAGYLGCGKGFEEAGLEDGGYYSHSPK